MRKHNNGFMQANNGRKQNHIQVIFGVFILNYNFENTFFCHKCFSQML